MIGKNFKIYARVRIVDMKHTMNLLLAIFLLNSSAVMMSVLRNHTPRRGFLSSSGLVIAMSVCPPIFPQPAAASVFFDIDRYGDKELKVATVNKLRQNVGDICISQPSLGPEFVKLMIFDALDYDEQTKKGGPDGSVLTSVLSSKTSSPLTKKAATELLNLNNKLKRFEITNGDMVSFAGAMAIEEFGGPRIVVQLGKMVTPASNSNTNSNNELPFTALDDNADSTILLEAFERSGLTSRELTLLLFTVKAMERSAAQSSSKNVMGSKIDDNEFTCEECGDEEIFIPTSFAKQSDIYGEKVAAKLDNALLKDVAEKKKGVPAILTSNDKIVAVAKDLAGQKEVKFQKAISDSYTKLLSNGANYIGGKQATIMTNRRG